MDDNQTLYKKDNIEVTLDFEINNSHILRSDGTRITRHLHAAMPLRYIKHMSLKGRSTLCV